MRIAFVLPSHSPIPVGGFAVVYEYANGLAARGHDITVVHPRRLAPRTGLRTWYSDGRWARGQRRLGPRAVEWFPIDSRVRFSFVADLRERFVPVADAVVATAWRTASLVHDYGKDRGAKLYLLQQHETWWGASADEIDATWRLPLHKVATARWLGEHAARIGEGDRTTYVANGIDATRYHITVPIEDRRPFRIAMLFHEGVWKGVEDGLAAMTTVRNEIPELEVVLFGAFPRPDSLPCWVTYRENPYGDDLVRLYNSCAIFLHPSWSEGSPLPPAEAMACGCALVAAANPGVADYARDEENALLAPVRQPPRLAEAVLRLMRDDALRQHLARRGRQDMLARPWSASVERFEAVLRAQAAAHSPLP